MIIDTDSLQTVSNYMDKFEHIQNPHLIFGRPKAQLNLILNLTQQAVMNAVL